MAMDHPYPNSFPSLANLMLLSLSLASFLLLLWITVSSSSSSRPLLPLLSSSCSTQSTDRSTITGPRDELEDALRKASMPNKTVIITVVNRAYVDQSVDADKTMLDVFVDSFWLGDGTRGLLDHVLVVAMDQTAYQRCRFQKLNCYRLKTEDVDFREEKLYMSQDFIKMMWRRTLFLRDVLERGYNFIFTDTDVVWLRNPFTKLSKNESEDLQVSGDGFNGDPRSEENHFNTGFYFIRSNNKTIALFNEWYSRRENATGMKEQDVLLDLMHEGMFKKLGLSVRFLDTLFFSGFCSDSNDFEQVTTVHANCCRSIRAKVFDLTAVLRDWKRFKWSSKTMTAINGTASSPTWTDHVACWQSWKV